MEAQGFTPLFEVLCGLNAAFALWDGLGKRVVALAVSWRYAESRFERLKLRAKVAGELLGDAGIVSSVGFLAARALHAKREVFLSAERITDMWRFVSVLLVLLNIWIIALAGFDHSYKLPWVSWVEVAAFIFISLASFWGTVVGAVFIAYVYEKELRACIKLLSAMEREMAGKLEKVKFL